MKTLSLILLLTASLYADGNYYLASYSSTLSGTTDALTLQVGTTTTRDIRPIVAWVRCSAACSFSLVINGTAATTTTLTTASLPGNTTPSQATAWSASNVGAGTTLATYNLEGAGTFQIDLSKFVIPHAPNSNLTISIASFTGTWRPTIQWSEQ
jgi:hypothetical protein